jgi:branched-chain amino acid transport system substrate-binding protein
MPQSKCPIAGLLISVLLVLSCLATGVVLAQDHRTALIGFSSRLSDALPQSALQGAQLAVDEANRQSARQTDPIRFKLLVQDDRGNPNTATHIAAYFINSGVVGVIGPWSSDAALAVAPLYEQAGIAQLNFNSSRTELTGSGYRTTFRVVGSVADIGMALAVAAIEVLQGHRMAVIGNETAYSKAVSEVFSQAVTARSKSLLQRSTVASNTADFNAALTAAMDANVDVIFFSASVVQVPAFLNAVKRLNVQAKILLAGGASNHDFSAQDNGHFYVMEPDIAQPQCASWKAFAQQFQRQYSHPPSTYSRYAYNATTTLIRAIRQVNSTDVRQVVQALHQTRYAGLGGDIAFDQAGNRLDPVHTLYRAEGAKWLPLRSFPADSVAATRCGKP